MKAVALIDGEHYPPVVRDALAALPYEWMGAILVGGTEKLRAAVGDGIEDYGVPLVDGFDGAEIVVDLSDEPVLGPVERFRWVSRALAAGLTYVGADFRFDPPVYEAFPLPSLAVIGTGKRVGKTAVSAHVARLLARDRSVVAVAMGRGGPAEPEVIDQPPTIADLVALSRAGRHAASDHLELAALTGITTIGCRRAGGGLAGAVFTSNVSEGLVSRLRSAPRSSSSTAVALRFRRSTRPRGSSWSGRGTTPTRTSTTTGGSSRISSSRSAGTSRARCESTCGSLRRSR